jgi:hypothetical protein
MQERRLIYTGRQLYMNGDLAAREVNEVNMIGGFLCYRRHGSTRYGISHVYPRVYRYVVQL